jgi:hypothetical protein
MVVLPACVECEAIVSDPSDVATVDASTRRSFHFDAVQDAPLAKRAPRSCADGPHRSGCAFFGSGNYLVNFVVKYILGLSPAGRYVTTGEL